MKKPQHKQEAPLNFAEEKARLAIESAELGVYELSIPAYKMLTTVRAEQIFGFSRPMNHEAYLNAIHPEDIIIRNKAVEYALATGHLTYEARVIWPDRSIHWVRITGSVFYKEDKPASLLGVMQDITEQKNSSELLARQVQERTKDLLLSNQELQKINAELQQYVHVSTHDLQEPLRKIRTYTGMIMTRDYETLSAASKIHFEKITAAAERLSNSLRDLLNFNSINRDEQYAAVDLNSVITMAESDLELVISQKSATITSATLPAIRAVPVQMHQLFYNLLNNALKFSQADTPPAIDITWHKISSQNAQQYHHLDGSRKYVEIVVRDNGIGFDQQNAEKIFTMFQRLHDRRVYNGTGIGLALCKKVVQNHNGKIWASSAPGKGASFHIILPEA